MSITIILILKLQLLKLELVAPASLHLCDYKNFIVGELKKYGDPLRWAIVFVNNKNEKVIDRKFIVEAVLITA